MHILVVDDDPVIRMSLRTILTAEGYKVTTAADGEEAVLKLSDIQFELLVCDIYMPHVDGLRLRNIVRAMPASAKLPILFVSGRDDAQTTNVVHDNILEGFFKKGGATAELLSWVKYLMTPVHKRSSIPPHTSNKISAEHRFYGRGRQQGGARTPML